MIIRSIILTLCVFICTINAYAECTLHSAIGANTDNATLVKAGTVKVASISVCNINAAVRYLKLYNKATAPTCGTDVPVTRLVMPINGCTSYNLGGGNSQAGFALGLGYCMVTGITDASTTAVAASEQLVNICYQ